MPFFRYVARNKAGKLIEESLEAVKQEDLINSLQARGLFVISIAPVAQLKKKKQIRRRYHRSVKMNDLIMFSRELATLLSSGVTLIKSLDILCKQIESQTLLRTDQRISRLRGQFHVYQGIKLMPTYHPAFLLRNPRCKRDVWEDVQKVKAEYDRE